MENSAWGRCLSVLFSPKVTFEKIREQPVWWVPLVVLLVLSLASVYVVTDKMDLGELTRMQLEEADQGLTEEQIDQQAEFMGQHGTTIQIVTVLLFTVIGYPIVALLFFLGMRMVGGAPTFSQTFATMLYAFMPSIIVALLSIAIVMGVAELDADRVQQIQQQGGVLTSSAAMFADEDTHPAVAAVLANIDVFVIWILILMVIGFTTVARVKQGGATAVVLSLFGLWIVIRVGLAMLGAAFGGG
ncbi:MAG: YIP1 family protein [Acidobacteriota bacterium]